MEQIRDRGEIKGLKVVLILPSIFLCLAFLLKIFYSLPLRDSFLWYIGVFFCFFIPGNLLVRCIGFNKDEYFVNFFHSIALGAALMPLVYTIIRRLSHPELLYIFVIVVFLFWFILNIHEFKEKKGDVYTSPKDLLSTLVLIGMVFILLHLSHFTDVVFLENGFKVRNIYLTETFFHLALINVLKYTFPAFYPFAGGINFSHYHLNMHLEIEMFNRLFSIDTLKLTFFYFPFLYFCLLVFVPYIFIRKYWGLRFTGVLTGILMFGSDLSFVPGLLGIFAKDIPWNVFINPTIWSLLTLNGNLPALFVMFLCVFYLKKYFENGRFSYLVFFAILGFSAYGFKSSMGPHIMGASFLTGIASIVLMEDKRKGKLLCTVSALTILMMVIDAMFFRSSAGNTIFSIELFNRFHDSLKYLGISNMPWIFYPVVFFIYIVAAFSIRTLGFYLARDIVKKIYFDPIIVFLIVFAISGFFLSEFIFLGTRFSLHYKVNNSVWFSVQSLMAAWLLLSFFLLKMQYNRKRFLGTVVLAIFLSAPSTVQFLSLRFDPTYYTVTSNAMEIVRYLEATPPKSVILHPPNLKYPSLASDLTGRPSVLSFFQSYAIETIGSTETKNRLKDIHLFFDLSNKVNRSFILNKYKVDYVYAPILYAAFLDKETMLAQVLKNSEYVLYRVNMSDNSL